MLESPHVLVGAAIATKIGNPVLAIPLALGSHFIMDMVPHWNPHINREIKKYGKPTITSKSIIIFDSFFALASGSYIAYSLLPNTVLAATVLLCCFAAVLPDVVEIPYYFLNQKSNWAEKWITWQKSIQNDAPILPGVLTQIIVMIAAVSWILA